MKFSEILSLFKQGKGTAKSHMKNLIEMAAVDGNFEQIEYDLLKAIAKRNGISENQLNEIRNNPHDIVFEVPTDSRQKFHQLYDLVHMMSMDNEVHNEESKLCYLFAIKFGYTPTPAKELIDAIRNNILNNQGHDETMKRVSLLISPMK
jgi:uncharacterized tellurite resistance protein B-like protein